jgi:hypothetical protein
MVASDWLVCFLQTVEVLDLTRDSELLSNTSTEVLKQLRHQQERMLEVATLVSEVAGISDEIYKISR